MILTDIARAELIEQAETLLAKGAEALTHAETRALAMHAVALFADASALLHQVLTQEQVEPRTEGRVYVCPNTGARVKVEGSTLVVTSDENHFVWHPIPIGLIHRALEREGYTVMIEKPA